VASLYFHIISHSSPGVFLNASLLCYVDDYELGVILRPKIESVTGSRVKLSFSPPSAAIPGKVLVYTVKYRKVGRRFWKSTSETRRLQQTVTGLDENSMYEFRVMARYQGVESKSVTAKTKKGT